MCTHNKVRSTIRFDKEIYEFFKKNYPHYQSEINRVLLNYVHSYSKVSIAEKEYRKSLAAAMNDNK